ncbi:erythroblast NAD(P)(+)--arginine ADP-ribosyltransferase-like [Rhineura floridana]|uniref:erythroblast NAD(P)(+)--arginine ADP-ribosyltransferase-like n=1 Tax=Rhineura floridana TaxID=261503 RepID=UPI002AC88B72|nr:erythroblast NAD(P)(+)--arginine ADP-ribosyltransferase-like [Rhineura floridana]
MSTNTTNPILNMAHYSLDDKYEGCLASMRSHLKSLIQRELNTSEIYSEAWETALFNWQANQSWLYPRNMEELSEVAIWAYTLEHPPLYREFSAATHTAGKGPKEYEDYPFKSLHFLLTHATMSFRPTDLKCVEVYRGVSVEFSVNGLFRFGQFTSTSENLAQDEKFEMVTFFKLFTCKGIEISEMSLYQEEEEVLVPPYEMFKVTLAEDTSNGKTVQAKSVGTCSYHNCAFVGQGTRMSQN